MARRPSSGNAELVRVDASELNALVKRLRTVEDRKLKARLRKALKESAKPMVDAVRDKVLEPTPHGDARANVGRIRYSQRKGAQEDRRRTVRQGIAKGVTASLRSGGRDAQLLVTASPRFLGKRAPMLKAYNKRSFRHPLFGNRNYWHTQQGNPYFGDTIYNNRDEIVKRLAAAMEAVAKDITG